jgi:hypothetical protein
MPVVGRSSETYSHSVDINNKHLWLMIKSKSKAVPLHAMETLGGRGGIAPILSRPRHYMGVSGQNHVPTALYPHERTPSTHCTGGWVGLRAGLDTEVRGKILCPYRGSNPVRPVVQSVVRHYTDRATRLLRLMITMIKFPHTQFVRNWGVYVFIWKKRRWNKTFCHYLTVPDVHGVPQSSQNCHSDFLDRDWWISL